MTDKLELHQIYKIQLTETGSNMSVFSFMLTDKCGTVCIHVQHATGWNRQTDRQMDA